MPGAGKRQCREMFGFCTRPAYHQVLEPIGISPAQPK